MSDRKLTRAKRELRERMRDVRNAIDPHRREGWSSTIVGAAHELPEVVAARTVTAYLSFGSEIPTGELIAALDAEGKRVGVPIVRDAEMVMVAFRPGDPTARGEFGMQEPAGGEEIRRRRLPTRLRRRLLRPLRASHARGRAPRRHLLLRAGRRGGPARARRRARRPDRHAGRDDPDRALNVPGLERRVNHPVYSAQRPRGGTSRG